jgi:hypothetical protein
VSSATDTPESLWPPAEALRDTALLLAGLVLVVLLALAAPFFALTRAGLVLHERRSA